MTNLELVYHDYRPQNRRPIVRTVVAMSTSYSTLVKYAKDEYQMDIGEPVSQYDNYLTIHNSSVVILQSKK